MGYSYCNNCSFPRIYYSNFLVLWGRRKKTAISVPWYWKYCVLMYFYYVDWFCCLSVPKYTLNKDTICLIDHFYCLIDRSYCSKFFVSTKCIFIHSKRVQTYRIKYIFLSFQICVCVSCKFLVFFHFWNTATLSFWGGWTRKIPWNRIQR